ncbi:hypothetical protein [Reichenbachiella versicolor]|uniref:hypothetical protein n=1 Tax=Reichenbachiella versicolor TaxID=1821036 RepID=UPI000D6E6E56|nr:hypothetical protein [Reichenbachiella versicolor]
MSKFFFNVTVLSISLGALHIYYLGHKDVLTLERAVAPIEHLTNAHHAIEKERFQEGYKEIEKAIFGMKIIEKNADSTAMKFVDEAIEDLKLVEIEIKNDSVIMDDLNHAFFNALNSIAYANLRISENRLEHGQKFKAMNLLSISFREMLSSLEYATTSTQKKHEEKAVADVRKFLKDLKQADYIHDIDLQYHLEYDTINDHVEETFEPMEVTH